MRNYFHNSKGCEILTTKYTHLSEYSNFHTDQIQTKKCGILQVNGIKGYRLKTRIQNPIPARE